MPSGLRETSKGHFEIYYEAPWGGVASDKSQTDINPNQLVIADGISIRDGKLAYSNFLKGTGIYDLELLPPTNVPPPGAYVNLAIVSSVSIKYAGNFDVPPADPYAKWLGMEFTVGSTTDLKVGTTFTVTSGSIYPYGGRTLSIVTIVDATHFTIGYLIDDPFGDSSSPPTYGAGVMNYYSTTGGGAPNQDWPGAYACLLFNAGNYLCAVDQYGFSYIATLQSDDTIKFQYDQTAPGCPNPNFGIPTAVKVVNGVAYISVYTTGILYAYTPGVSYTVASAIVAGQIIDIFDEYMLQFNTNIGGFSSGGMALGVQPCAVNWSGPDKFTTWDPSLDRTAGYQILTSVEDYISGFVAVANIGYIFKRSGITQITATGVAIQPFNFTTYWNSVIGQGLTFIGTLVQYGQYVFLVTDSNIYLFSGGNFQAIGDVAKTAIYSSFNSNPTNNNISLNLLSGGFLMYPFNGTVPCAEYLFCASNNALTSQIVFWLFNVNNKTWTSVTKLTADLLAQYVANATSVTINFIKNASLYLNYLNSSLNLYFNNLPINITYINFSYLVAGVAYQKTFLYFNIVNTTTSDTSPASLRSGSLNLVFREEEIKLGREPTIRRVLVVASGGNGNDCIVDISVNGVSFGSVNLINVAETTYYSQEGIYTGERPQLTLASSTFNGRISKVMMAGTYADGDID
jgi:hypothetical protein